MTGNEGMKPSTRLFTDYLMTYVAPLDPPVTIDDGLMIVNVRPGGWAKGPDIQGTFVSPGADWLRIMPSGAMRLDVRALLQTDDGEHIYISYNGVIKNSPEGAERLGNGELLTHHDIPYFIAAPTFQTASKKYAWLNDIQAINKMTEIQFGPEGYVKYDVFLVR